MNDKRLSRQIDLHVSGLHVREAGNGEKSRTIEGHAVVFGVRSVNLTPWSDYREVYEVIEPGSITLDLLNRSDVVLTAFHDRTAILGRWRQGKGTLSLELDQRGLMIRCTLAETSRADELLSAIERGDISGMSFSFRANEEDSENGVSYERLVLEDHDNKQVWLRHVKRIDALYDVTIAGHPAYPQTDVAQREIEEKFFDAHCPRQESDMEKQQREAEAEAQRKAEEEARAAEAKAAAERSYNYRRRKLSLNY